MGSPAGSICSLRRDRVVRCAQLEMEMTEQKSGRASTVTWASLIAALTIALTIIGGAIGILNWLYTENNRLRAEITSVRVEIAGNQVSRNEFRESLKELAAQIDTRLARIEGKLSGRP